MTSSELVCPGCGADPDRGAAFCAQCGMPLVTPGGEPLDEPLNDAHERARKIDPRYTEGELVRVAGGRNQAEAELIQGMLLEEGVPSILRRTAGFDVPDFLAAGPRDVLVPESGAEAARDVLREADVAETVEPAEPGAAGASAAQLRIVLAVLGGSLLAAFLAWLLVNSAG